MEVKANIENMIETYKEMLKANVLGQSGKGYFYYLQGVKFAMNHLGLSDEQIEEFNNSVYDEVIELGHSDLVESYRNEEYEKNWNRLDNKVF